MLTYNTEQAENLYIDCQQLVAVVSMIAGRLEEGAGVGWGQGLKYLHY